MGERVKSRYPALQIIASWYRLLALVIGVISMGVSLAMIFMEGSRTVGVYSALATVVFVILTVALAETIKVVLDTEENTRNSSEHLSRLVEIHQNEQMARSQPAPVTPRKIKKRIPLPVEEDSDQGKSIQTLIRTLSNDGLSDAEIAAELKKENMPALRGYGAWTPETVRRVLNREQ